MAGANVQYDVLDLLESIMCHFLSAGQVTTRSLQSVVWSKHSVASEWVRSESSRARDLSKYIGIRLDEVELPIPFDIINTMDFSGWDGNSNSTSFEILVAELTRTRSSGRPYRLDEAVTGTATQAKPRTSTGASKRNFAPTPRARKTSVFVAHASGDKPALRAPIRALLDAGFLVWIDKPFELELEDSYERRLMGNRLHFGDDWKERIKVAIDKSDIVLACWSKDAIRGRREQFYYEVFLGLIGRKLMQCRIDKVPIYEIGMPYTFSHIADLSDFSEGAFSRELDFLMQDICAQKKSFWGRLVG